MAVASDTSDVQTSRVTLQGDTITAVSPEGTTGEIKIKELLATASPAQSCADEIVLPDGGRKLIARGHQLLLMHETPPRVFNFKWISKTSKAKHGEDAEYRDVRIALPYVIVMALFECDHRGNVALGKSNECFFSKKPLASLDEPLLFPALLNCSKFPDPTGRPLSWICTQYLMRRERRLRRRQEPCPNEQLRRGLRSLLHCLFESGFNYSSEFNEGNSWYSESSRVDRRIASVEAWEEATSENSLFVLDVPWLETNLTARQIADRIFEINGLAKGPDLETVDDVARIVFNHRKPR